MFTADAVLRGYKISYNDAAMFYDEQPRSMKVVWNQRMRWSKGHLQAFVKTGGGLLKGLFTGRGFVCYDIFMTVLPESLILLLKDILYTLAGVGLLFLGDATLDAWRAMLLSLGAQQLSSYFSHVIYPAYIMIIEHKRIPKFSLRKKITGCLLWFIFPLIGTLTMVLALFCPVEWKPIPHDSEKRPDIR